MTFGAVSEKKERKYRVELSGGGGGKMTNQNNFFFCEPGLVFLHKVVIAISITSNNVYRSQLPSIEKRLVITCCTGYLIIFIVLLLSIYCVKKKNPNRSK